MSEQKRPAIRPFELDPAKLRPEPPEDPSTTSDLPAAPALPRAPSSPPSPPLSGWRLGRWLGGGVLGILILQALDYLATLFATTPLLALPMTALVLVVGATAGGLLWRELRDLRRLSRRSGLRQRAARLVGSELHGQADPVLRAVGAELARDLPSIRERVGEYRAQVSDAHSDGEQLVLFERTVLEPVDRRAYRLVLESSRDIGIMTALSPLGLLDGLLVLWRTLLLLKQISALYGMAPGPTANLALLRRCLRNAAMAGLADVVTQATLEHAGAGLLTLLSARAGQGVGNALLAGKLGIEAIKEARPLPFVASEQPRLGSIRKALFDDAKSGIKK